MNPSILATDVEMEARSFMTKVYGWMSAGLALTGSVAWWTVHQTGLMQSLLSNSFLFYGLIIAELLLVIGLSSWINRLTAASATGIFLAYSAFNGVTFSVLFVVYTTASIASTFFITAGMFGAMSLYGYTTKRDLTSMGSFLFMALLGLILASIVNLFWANPALYWITTYAGILIFVGLTAYDTQKIKQNNILGNEGTDEDRKEAILGALTLYLDFINMFLNLLRVLGKRK